MYQMYSFPFSTPGGNTLSAAEHTCAMISALARLFSIFFIYILADTLIGQQWSKSMLLGT